MAKVTLYQSPTWSFWWLLSLLYETTAGEYSAVSMICNLSNMCLGVWWVWHICLCPFSQLWGPSQGKWKDVPTETVAWIHLGIEWKCHWEYAVGQIGGIKWSLSKCEFISVFGGVVSSRLMDDCGNTTCKPWLWYSVTLGWHHVLSLIP